MDSNFLLPWGDAVRCMQMYPHAYSTYPDLFSDNVQQQPSANHARWSPTLTHHTSNTETNPAPPQTQFLPMSCSGQKSSLFSPAQSHNHSSISTFLQNAFMLLPLKFYPLGEDYSHPNLNNTEVNDAYTASFASKAPQGVEPHKIRRVRNTIALRKSWLNFKIRVGFFF